MGNRLSPLGYILLFAVVFGLMAIIEGCSCGQTKTPKPIEQHYVKPTGYSDKVFILDCKVNDMEYKIFTNIDGGGVHVINVTLDHLQVDKLEREKLKSDEY